MVRTMSLEGPRGCEGAYDPEQTGSAIAERLFWASAFVSREFALHALIKRAGALQGEPSVVTGSRPDHFTRFYNPVKTARNRFITFGEFFVRLADGTETRSWPLVDINSTKDYSIPEKRIQRPQVSYLLACKQGDEGNESDADGGYHIFDTLIGGNRSETEELWSAQDVYAKAVLEAAKSVGVTVSPLLQLSFRP